jgi:membrane protein
MAARSLSIVRRFLREYLECGASQYAGMLAFSLFVAMLPLTLGVLDLWGLVARSPRGFSAVRQVLIDMFPAATQSAVRQVVLQAGEHAGLVAVLALVSLGWFGTGVFSTAGFALNRIHRMPNRPVLQQRLRGLWLLPALVGSAYLAVAVNIAVRLGWLPGVLVPAAIWLTLTWLIGFLYRLAPSRMLTRAQLLPGAGLAALGIVGLGYAFPLYTQLAAQLSTESRFFTVVFGLVAWVYGIAQAVLIGAVYNRARIVAREEGGLALAAVAPAPAVATSPEVAGR